MKTFEAPSWMIAPMVSTGVKQSDYFLYAAGRALGMMKMAALALEHPGQTVLPTLGAR